MGKAKSKKSLTLSPAQSAILEAIERQIGLVFQDKHLLLRALTHRSYVKDDETLTSGDHNERLEFLGDAVLSLVTAEEVFEKMPHAHEGTLTLLRASYVCQAHLADAARRLAIGSHIRVAKSMRLGGPVDLPSVLSDVMEAIFGAAYLDAGFGAAKKIILQALGPVPQKVTHYAKDPKTELQERFQAALSLAPIYTVAGVSGPPHAPIFMVEVSVNDRVLAKGEGSSKKEAAQEAAKVALGQIESLDKAGLESFVRRESHE